MHAANPCIFSGSLVFSINCSYPSRSSFRINRKSINWMPLPFLYLLQQPTGQQFFTIAKISTIITSSIKCNQSTQNGNFFTHALDHTLCISSIVVDIIYGVWSYVKLIHCFPFHCPQKCMRAGGSLFIIHYLKLH